MNTNKTIVCGFLAVIFALALAACSAAGKGQKLTGTDSFRFTVINNGTAYSVSAGTATEGTVNIPAYYRPNADSDYLPVTEIGDFSDCRNITKITIPNGVTSIGEGAFSGCSNLTSITIGADVTSIGNSAFYNCTALTSITIPNSVTTIGGSAFAENQLTRVTIPNSVISIGDSAFYNNQLTSITIPNSVTSIGGGAFYNNQLTSITIGANVTFESTWQYDIFIGFENIYNANGKAAGTYTYNNQFDERINEQIIDIISKGRLAFHIVDSKATDTIESYYRRNPSSTFDSAGNLLDTSIVPSDVMILGVYQKNRDGMDEQVRNADNSLVYVALKREVGLDWKHIRSATAECNFWDGKLEVTFHFDNEGSEIFYRFTSANIGKSAAVILDDKVRTQATIQSAVRESVRLGGSFLGDFDLPPAWTKMR